VVVSIGVVIADDHPLMRSAIRGCLDTEPDIIVLGEAADGHRALELIRRHAPDVAIVDLRMPMLDGFETIRRITGGAEARSVRTKALALTSYDLEEDLVPALRAGVSGFLLKDATADELVSAIRALAAGDAVLAPRVTRRLLEHVVRAMPPAPAPGAERVHRLTARELEVLRLVARGLSNAEIADAVHIASSSVKTHIGHLLAKLGLTDRVHLVIFAYETGLIRPGHPAGAPAPLGVR
jgi:DNA-binding NarL/FixJ family response regulator